MSIITKFNVFSEIDHNLVNNIRLFYKTKSDLLFVTFDNSVFHYKIIEKQLKKFEVFCVNQFIIKFECSHSDGNYAHYMALTDDGCVYSWGNNTYGQLGHTNDCVYCNEPKNINDLVCSLSEQIVIDISCGYNHSLVLTKCGNVYAFGRNNKGQCGNERRNDQLIPHKVNIPYKVIAISCGDRHSVALTKRGSVFGWGDNKFRQIGIDALQLK